MSNYAWIIPAAPLLAFFVNILFGKGWRDIVVAGIAIVSVAISFVFAIVVFLNVPDKGATVWDLYKWIPSGNFQVSVGFYVDHLAAIMLLVVTFVSLLVHVYSIGYMHGDPGTYRFFAYLPLFTFSMLMLVLANNFLELYMFWEAVGVCSYLLIGFWYSRPSASAAALKAFIVNRVGDFGFGLGVFLVFVTFGTLAYQPVFDRAGTIGAGTLTVMTLLLFMGSMGKSAQFPLHVWLPDAMEGPTPVSALIHAATMVTAGVYLVARAHPLFNHATGTLTVVAVIGLVTALLGATIAVVQTDIKRVMAYSTISQLGYMFFGLGVGAYTSAIFHLFTHAFFKALLFLGAGSVMHGLGGETDMRKMGGLKRYMPLTFWPLVAASAALAGVFPFAGFWSKDEILGQTFARGYYVIYVLGTFASFLTAFYITRLIVLTFLGQPRFDTHAHHPHESPPVMTVPLWILGILSVVAGIADFPPDDGWFHRFLDPVFGTAEAGGGFTTEVVILMILATIVALFGIVLALGAYYWQWVELKPSTWARRFAPVYDLVVNKYYFDAIYNALFVRTSIWLGRALWRFDSEVIDGAVNSLADGVADTSADVRHIQTGFVGNYALSIGLGVVLLIAYLFFAR